jgi:hypothetical protein
MCTTCDDLGDRLAKAIRKGDRMMAEALRQTMDAHMLIHEQEGRSYPEADGLLAQLWPGARVAPNKEKRR